MTASAYALLGYIAWTLTLNETAITDSLAPWVLAARIAQSSVHLVSTSTPAVLVRFSLFMLQLLAVLWWIIQLAIQWLGA